MEPSIVHVPWSPDEADQQLRVAADGAEHRSRRTRLKTNAGWFLAVAIATYALIRLNEPKTEGLFYASIIVSAVLGYFSALSGSHARDHDWLVEDWKLQSGHGLLSGEDLLDLATRAAASQAAASTLHRWGAAGHRLRERDRRHVEALMAHAGIASPRRPTSMSDVLMDCTE